MTAKRPKGLGKGLGALLNAEAIPGNEARTVLELSINDINPNQDQPRKQFDETKLNQLADSIREHGVIQPIIVCKNGDYYSIVAGERRWRAARIAGLKTIPAIVRDLTEHQILQQALIENIQRQDLNAIEEAMALERLLSDYSMTQEELAKSVGRSRPAISNTLRLLNLPEEIKAYVRDDKLTAGHARSILALPDLALQMELAKEIVENGLSVRESEKLVQKLLNPKRKKSSNAVADEVRALNIRRLEEDLSRHFAARIKIMDKNDKGAIRIEYDSADERERLFEILLNEHSM